MTARIATASLIEDALTAGADFRLITPKGAIVSFTWFETEPARDMPNMYEGWKVELGSGSKLDLDFVVQCSEVVVQDCESGQAHGYLRLDLVDSDLTFCRYLLIPHRTRIDFGIDGQRSCPPIPI